jgi:hypothetical protein
MFCVLRSPAITAISGDFGDRIRGKVLPDGKEDILAAIHSSGCADGYLAPVLVVEPGAYIAAVGAVLVGSVPERMV